jgi:hypothetical protein
MSPGDNRITDQPETEELVVWSICYQEGHSVKDRFEAARIGGRKNQ